MSKVDPTLNLTPTPAERKASPDIWGPKHTPAEEQARISWEPPKGLAETIAQKTKEIKDARLCQLVGKAKPCPHCGGDAYLSKREGQYWFACEVCAAQGGWSKTESGALDLWNDRYPQQPNRLQV